MTKHCRLHNIILLGVFLIGWTSFFIGCGKPSQSIEPVLTNQEIIVEFPDVILANEVRKALELPKDAAITKSKLATLETLQTYIEGISDLRGLEHATSLDTLTIKKCEKINDVSILPQIKQLHSITQSPLRYGNRT